MKGCPLVTFDRIYVIWLRSSDGQDLVNFQLITISIIQFVANCIKECTIYVLIGSKLY